MLLTFLSYAIVPTGMFLSNMFASVFSLFTDDFPPFKSVTGLTIPNLSHSRTFNVFPFLVQVIRQYLFQNPYYSIRRSIDNGYPNFNVPTLDHDGLLLKGGVVFYPDYGKYGEPGVFGEFQATLTTFTFLEPVGPDYLITAWTHKTGCHRYSRIRISIACDTETHF